MPLRMDVVRDGGLQGFAALLFVGVPWGDCGDSPPPLRKRRESEQSANNECWRTQRRRAKDGPHGEIGPEQRRLVCFAIQTREGCAADEGSCVGGDLRWNIDRVVCSAACAGAVESAQPGGAF